MANFQTFTKRFYGVPALLCQLFAWLNRQLLLLCYRVASVIL